jgi:YVTN family beta-propeller protein
MAPIAGGTSRRPRISQTHYNADIMKLAYLLAAAVTTTAVAGLHAVPDAKGGGMLLVTNKGDRTLGIIDTAAGRQIAAIDEHGITGHEVIASADGKTAYVPIYGDSGVGKPGTDGRHMAVIDLASRRISATVDFGRGVRPHCVLVGPVNGLLYVTTELDQTVSIVDPKSLKVVGTVPTGQAESHMLAITRDGRRGYTANVGPGTVSALDLEARKTVAVIPVSRQTQRIALSIDDKKVFTADQTAPRLAVIDTATNTVERWVPLPASGYGTAPTPDGRFLLVAVPHANKVAVVDLQTYTVSRTIDVPATPQEVLVRPDGRVAYVSCDVSGKVAAIRLSDWAVDALIDAGHMADGLAWASSE